MSAESAVIHRRRERRRARDGWRGLHRLAPRGAPPRRRRARARPRQLLDGRPRHLGFAPRFRRQLEVLRGDIRNLPAVLRAARGARVIYHQAAMRSVPRSVKDPLGANANNVGGTLNVLEAARRCRVPRVVYASSSSVYGDRPDLPKRGTSRRRRSRRTRRRRRRASSTPPSGPVSTASRRSGSATSMSSAHARIRSRSTRRSFHALSSGGFGAGRSRFTAMAPSPATSTYIDNVVEANLLAAKAPGAPGEVFNVGAEAA